jgi:sugar phosphate permease
MAFGIIGSILLSLYLKKTFNYRRALLVVVSGTALMTIMVTVWMNTVRQKIITTFLISLLGLAGNPIVTLCYELGA